MKPKILLCAKSKAENYVNAVAHCGAVGEIAYSGVSIDEYDGLILCGGGDIHPSYYYEEIAGSYSIDTERDALEFALTEKFIESGKPVLGICRGLQLLNIYFGGSLYQDIDNRKYHASGAEHDLIHPVQASSDGLFMKLYGLDFTVNSYHHQAIKKLGQGLVVTLTADEGKIVEGIEHVTLPVFAVQWHPERMCFEKSRSDTVDGAKIIQYFVDLCRNR